MFSSFLFTNGADWFLPIWTAGSEVTVSVDTEGATSVEALDQSNNRIDLLERDGQVVLQASGAPIYLMGRGGGIFEDAARRKSVAMAKELLDRQDIARALGNQVRAAVAKVPGNNGMLAERDDFFTLIRALPRIEKQWHTGRLTKAVAASATAHLTRLLRELCVMEEVRGEAFLEPLSDTIARCKEYQAYYLTSSSGSDGAFERGDWLLNEIRRLTDEAQALASAGRRIEGSAVGAVAEWRARGLEFAAQAGQLQVADIPPVEQVDLEIPEAPEEPEPEIPAPVMEVVAAPEPSEAQVHVIAPGDTLSGIASKYDTKLSELLELNELTSRSTLRIGQEIKIPGAAPVMAEPEPEPEPEPESEEPEPTPEPEPEDPEPTPAPDPEPEPEPAPTSTPSVHKVQRGDTMSGIAERYDVGLSKLLEFNGMSSRSRLSIGQEIKIPGGATASGTVATPASESEREPGQPPNTSKVVHTVQRGETTWSIAEQYGVPEPSFRKWNFIRKGARLARGKQYTVFVPEEETSTDANTAEADSDGRKKITHVVGRGDSPYKIANRYGVKLEDFLEWNDLTKRSVLHIGDEYVVYVRQ